MKRIFLLFTAFFLFTGCNLQGEEGGESVDGGVVVSDAGANVEGLENSEIEDSKFEITPPEGFDQYFLPTGNGIFFTRTFENEEWMIPDKEGIKQPYRVEIGVFSEANIMGYENLRDFLAQSYSGYNYEFNGDTLDDGVFVNELRNDKAIKHFFLLSEDDIVEAYLEVPGFYFERHQKEFLEIVGKLKP